MSYADVYDELGGVAIVSLAGRFPGARDVEELWENLVAGRETISRFEESELEPANRFDMENRGDPGYVRVRGILEDVELFDAEFFRMSPREAEVTDPQQRLFLEASWEALERAGYDPESYDGAIGVYAGMSNNTYFLANLHSRPDVLAQAGELPMLGNEKDYLATRVSYKLNLNGPGINVATACSTSLVAVCQAVQGLLTHQCDLALAGGVSISVPQRRGYLHQDGFITSPDGHCRAFDERAAGTVFSNGLGIVVLKRLQDALEDGDGIFAVIRGTAVTNDGSARVSFTAPSVDGQAEAIAMAQALAGIDPGTIGYVEAHGTGTALGDPIEVAALTQAFRLETDASGYCALGSVKTNIGHLDAAAGVTGLIKVALALRHATIPPTLHFQAPNPKLNLPGTPFFVNTEVVSWPDLATPRRAGVSSLGAGGTNAHVVLEEAPPAPATDEARSEQLIVLSARSEPALRRMAERLRARLGADDDLALADVAYTLQAGRRRFEHRRAFVATSREDALELLESGDPTRVISEVQDAQGSSIAFMFPGQGAQRVNMGRELYESESVFRTEVDECAEILRSVLDIDLRSLLYPRDGDVAEAELQLSRTAITQPAVFVTSYALARLWKRWGVEPDVMIGHSLGEYVAACLAGVFSREDALTLVARRALLMQELPPGAMLAVRATVEELADVLVPELAVASLNAPRLNVLSGTPAAVEFAADQLRERGIAARPLATSHAFHSPMMDPILGRFEEIVNQVPCHAPAIPFVSSVTGDWIDQAAATDPKYWARQVREPVRFGEGAARLLDDPGRVYVEVGPGQTLVTLLRQQSTGASALATIASLGGGQSSAVESMLAAAGRLWSAGVDLDWSGVHSHGRRKRVLLPTYPFERKRYWVEPQPAATGASDSTASAHASHPTLPESSTRAREEDSNEMAFGAPIPQPTTDVSARLRALFSELSGLDESQLQPTAAFLDLGLDSLFLTQARTMVQKTFGVKVPFRDLLGDASTLAALAARIESQLPADALVEQQSLPTPATQAPLVKANVDLAHAADGLLEQVIRQQMALMSRQLDMLRDAGADSPRSAPAPAEPVSESRLNGAPDGSAASGSRQGGATPRVAFGPYRPPARGESARLTRRQSDALEALVDRYVRRTATSKRFTEENRGHLADPRSVAGFRRSWKEMVYPIVTTRSSGSKLWDLDGNEYVDLTNGFGSILFGHNPPFISEALEAQLRQGIEIGPQTPLAGDVSRQVSEMTGMERVAFCNTGSEAVTAAIRVARAVSGRDMIAMFDGAYHGIFDEVLVRAAKARGRQRSVPIAPGIPSSMVENILVLEYGAPESLAVLKARAPELAAVLVEPVQSRHPELQPVDFLRELRTITEQSEVALVFDEVVSGFRAHPGGAQALFGIRADLAAYGKVAGGGLPIGLVAGQGAYMDALDGGAWSYGDDSLPEVGVTFFAGTFVRHPLALAAARAVLGKLKEEGPELQRTLNIRTTQLVDELNEHAERMGAPVRVTHFASWFCFNFPADVPYASLFYAYMRHKGIHVWEGRAGFLTTAHTDEDIARVLSAFRDTIAEMQAADFLPKCADVPREDLHVAEARFALTEPQREICAATQMGDEANCSYNQCFVLKLHGPLSVESLHKALADVVERHEALRLSIDLTDESQRVLSDVEVALPLTDLSALDEQEREDAIARMIDHETRTPFDLAAAPLWRAGIIREAPDRHRLVFTAHHVVVDGWSSVVIFGDLAKIYSADRLGLPATLPPAASFRDFVADQQSPAVAAEMDAALEFWTAQYASSVPTFELPLDRARPAFKTYTAGRQVLAIDKALYDAIRTCAAQHGATQFVTLLAAFEVLVARLASVDDLTIGVPIAGQALQENSHLVAHAVNTIPLRCRVDTQQPFAEHLRAASRAFLDAQAHPRLTFGTLVQELRLPRDPSRTPLVSVIFNIDKLGSPFDFGDVAVAGVETPKAFENFDFGINAVDEGETILLECDFNADLFDATTVAGWLSQYRRLLERVAAEPTVPLAALSLLTPGERAVLVGEEPIPTFVMRDATLHGAFARQVAATPEAIAVSIDTASVREELSYAELDRRAEALAAHLRALGVGANQLVGLRVERSADVVIGILAILKAGGAYLPLDPVYPTERIAFMLQDAAARVVLTQRSLADELSALPVTCISMDAPLPPAPPAVTAAGDDLAYVIYTSGSTGQPKGVPITHRKVLRLYAATDAGPSFGPTDVWTLLYSYAFDASVWDIWGALLFGGRLVIVPLDVSHDMAAFRTLLEREHVTVLDQTPTAFRALIDADRAAPPGDFALRYVVLGGEALELQMLKPWFDRYGDTTPELVNTYGPTETTVQVTWRIITRADLAADTGSVIGVPIDDIRIYLLDAHGQPVPTGVTGEMYIAGAGVAGGYLNRPELTAQRFVPDPFHGGLMYRSGDLARRLPNGDLEFLGRVDQQVKIRGYRIELGEIEAAIAEHPAVGQVAVIDREDTPGEKKLVAYLVAGNPPQTLIADLREALRRRLPDYMVPAHFLYLDALPLTSNGKLDRKALPTPEQGHTEAREIVDPRSSSEALVVAVFNEVLGRSDVGVFDNFFDLGGHSLMVGRVMAKLRETARVDLPMRNLFERQTPEQLAVAIDAQSCTASGSASPAAAGQVEAPFALTEPQREMCAATLMGDEANCSYNQCFVLKLHGPLSVESLHKALADVVQRHEALRLSIDLTDESQRVLSDVEVALPLTDLSALDEQEREDAIARMIDHETRTPFDLAAAPLWRAGIIREAPDRHRLVFTAHHVVVDGWSSAVIFADLAKIYAADRLGLPATLPPAASFRDFVADQQSPAVAAEMDAALEFWAAQYASGVPAFELPLDRARPSFKTYTAGRQVLAIDKELYQAVRTCAAQQGATLIVALLAAFEVLVARLGSVDDLTIGVHMASQALQENGHLVANGVNTVPLRCRVDAQQRFAEHLRAASRVFLDAQAHQRLTFGTLVQKLRLPRDPSRTPLVSVIFNIDKLGSPFDFGDVAVAGVETPSAFYSFDLGLTAVDDGESILLACDFNADLFDAATVAGWLSQYRRLLECVAAAPTVPLAELSLLTPAEVAALVGDAPIPTLTTRDATLHAAFARQVAATPEAIAVSAETASGRVELSYAELDQRAEAVAARLRALAVGAGQAVGLRVERSPDVVIGILAILKAGAAYLPLDPLYPTERVAFMLSDAAVGVVLTQRAFSDELAALPTHCIYLDEPLPPSTTAAPAAVPGSGEDVAYVMYTSGSTGQPKGVRVTHHNVLRLFAATIPRFGFGPTDVWTLWHSYAFDISVSEFWGALLAGGRLVVVPQDTSRDPATFRALVEREHVTVLSQTPTGFQALIEADRTTAPGTFALRYILLCGEALHLQALQPWFDRYGDHTPQIINMYGPTEATLYVTYQQITQADLTTGAGSIIGKPLPDIRIYLLDTLGHPVPTGVPGELYIAGAGVAAGYLNRPELTAQRFLPDPFHGGPMYRSGDLARRLATGELEYLGRIDQQVKIRGFRIELGEIETAIAQHPAVKHVAVVDREDTPGDKKLVAYLIADDPPTNLIADLHEALRARLPEYMVPAHFLYLDALPLTTSGKLDRKALPDPQHQPAEPREIVNPRSSSEALVVALFNEVLGRSDVGVLDDFFELGGHSLMAARVMANLRKKARVDLPLRNLFERPTPEQLAVAIDALSWTAIGSASAAATGQGEREEIEL